MRFATETRLVRLSHAPHSDKCCLVTLFRVPQTHQASEDPNTSVSTVLIEKRRNEIATNWVKRP